MSVLTFGLWKAPQNSKVPALSHVLSLRATWTTTAAAGTATVSLPANYSNPGQLTAPTASAYDTNSEPQSGLRLVIQKMVVRDLNAAAVSGATGGGTIALQTNVSGSFAATPLSVTLPTAAAYAAGQVAVADIGQTPTGTFTANSQNLVLAPNNTMQLVVTAGTTQIAGNAAACTVDVFGHWVQGV